MADNINMTVITQPDVSVTVTGFGVKGDKGDAGDPATNLVTSVAGKTGAVTLDKTDVGLSNVDNTSDANKPISTATQAALDTKATTAALNAHTSSTSNPHSVTKAQVGLGNVDNTSDANKPVSTAQQTALNAKANASDTVNLTGNQTVAGVKTFSSSPIAPSGTSIGGALHLTGTGFPEGIVTAPVGSVYTDTAITNGALRWAKKTGTGNTGWQVVEGDTGWRSLIDGSRVLANNLSGWRVDAGGAGRTMLRIRRVNERVYINGWELWVPTGALDFWGGTQPRRGGITTIPSGFRGVVAAGWSAQPNLASWNAGSYQAQNMMGTVFPAYGNPTLDGWPDAHVLTVGQPTTAPVNNNWQVSLNIMYATTDNWPTTLPGVSA